MCGRYALGLRPSEVFTALQNDGMEIHESLSSQDKDVPLPNFNLAPGNFGLVYLAQKHQYASGSSEEIVVESNCNKAQKDDPNLHKITYKLQVMKWGLIPFWTKRLPDYGTLLKTINCRDDSLKLNKGPWNSMKATKRCVIIAQGFFEWLKKPEKIPHFVKRRDGKLLCLAGLYDSVEFEGSKGIHYTYTIITTNSNRQFESFHDRMPVILENGSNELRKWLDPSITCWSQDLQSLLRPFDAELEIYPVSRDIGKLSKNYPRLIVPIASSENKSNIANFFGKNDAGATMGLNAINMKLEPKSEAIHTSLKSTFFKKDIEEKDQLELSSMESTALKRQSPKACGLGKKRILIDTYDDKQKKKVKSNNDIFKMEPPRSPSLMTKNIARKNRYTSSKSKIKECSKITKYFN
ncbi:Abasic site processing protein [Erysiphe necator]|nr:Abasic site processing protein [Erysiphe necator]